MPIQITKVRVDSVTITRDKIEGIYSLISERGDVVAKQNFNGYDCVKFEFDKALSRNLIEEVETEIELTIGIQQIVKEAKDASSQKQGQGVN